MPQWLSLVIFYTTVIVAFLSIIALVVACTTTPHQVKQQQTEHSPTGKTPTTSHNPQHNPLQTVSREWLTGLQDFEREYRKMNGMKSPYRISGESGGGDTSTGR
jgi:hypothetical protein